MALVTSSMMDLGAKAPSFTLKNVLSGISMSLEDCLGEHQAIVVAFICNHCPYVKHIVSKFSEVATYYQQRGIAVVAINSNDPVISPNDAPEKMIEFAKLNHFTFPYLFDASQETAKAYNAACTPDFFVFNKNKECLYRGRFDDATPGKMTEVTGIELRTALDCIITNAPVSPDQKPSIGCNIKWSEQSIHA